MSFNNTVKNHVKWPWHLHCQSDASVVEFFVTVCSIHIWLRKHIFFFAFPTCWNKWHQNYDYLNFIYSYLHLYKSLCPSSSKFYLSFLWIPKVVSHIFINNTLINFPVCLFYWYMCMPHQCLQCLSPLGEHFYLCVLYIRWYQQACSFWRLHR